MVPAFVEGGRGRLFVLLRRPPGGAAAPCVLIVPPFAEEMNKCRPMLAEVAQGLAARGVASVLPDLAGTGDSDGEFREAHWDTWLDDLARVARWSQAVGCPIRGLLCVRLGCILGARAGAALPVAAAQTVFWQPVLDGSRFLAQFLRLRAAASLMEDVRESVASLRERLTTESFLEVAGYELPAGLAGQVEAARLADALGRHLGRLHWIEIVRDVAGGLPEPSSRLLGEAGATGLDAVSHAIGGDPYWSSVEIVRNRALVDLTIRALGELA